ncbi:uncharacterized protein [Diadema antillarum]|uniref:uncharacterized protein n=1 Tax=Diadema antillarum TaxID=105358 RepID=UPI003A89719B
MLATQYLSEDTQTVLRAVFSPAFNISEQSIRPVVDLFNKIKKELPVDKFRLLVSLLLQIDFDPVPLENKYDILLIETRIVHLLQDYPDLALELTSLLHDASRQRDHYLNWLEHTRKPTDLCPDQHDSGTNNNVDARELDVEHGPTSNQTKGKESAERSRYKDSRSTSMEFEMSRQLYPAVPASLRSSLHATNQEEADTRKTVHSYGTSDKTPEIEDPSEVAMMPVEEEKNSGGTSPAHSTLTDGGERKLDQANKSDSADDLITSRLNDNEETKHCAKDSDVNSDLHAENREGVSTRKRVRRLGAREEDMLLRKVGSHCIMIGVKERNGATQNTDKTQSGDETSDGNPSTSRDGDEDEMVLVIDDERSKERHKKRKKNAAGKRRANMVKVTALCRAAAWLDKQEKRKQGKTKKGKTTDPDTCGDEGTQDLKRKSQGGTVDDFEAVSPMTSEYLTAVSDSVSGDESSTVDVCSLINSQDPLTDDCSGTTSDTVEIHASDSTSENMRFDSQGQKEVRVLTRPPALHLSVYQRSHCAVSSEDNDTQQENSGSSLTPTAEPRLGSLGHFSSSSSGTTPSKYDPNFPFTTAATVAAMSSKMDVCAFLEDGTVANCDNPTRFPNQETASRQRSVHVGTECNTVKCPSQVEESSFLSRLLRSPRPLAKTVAAEKKKSEKRRHRQPKKERKAKKPRRSRRLRRKRSRDGDESFHQEGDKQVYTTGKRHTCCS